MYNNQEFHTYYPDSFKLNLKILSDDLSDRFTDYILDYMLEQSTTQISAELFCYYSPPEEVGVFSTELNNDINWAAIVPQSMHLPFTT